MGLQEALDKVRPNERVMYRNGKAYMHLQYYPLDNGQTQLNVWYRGVDDTGHEELAGERHTSGRGDWVITALEQALRNAGIDPDHYRIIPIPPEWEQRIPSKYG
jgi:hypothetical protein